MALETHMHTPINVPAVPTPPVPVPLHTPYRTEPNRTLDLTHRYTLPLQLYST